jgi:ABC-type nitrate/sulfonate/bicarbonate transport system ATPase subunit
MATQAIVRKVGGKLIALLVEVFCSCQNHSLLPWLLVYKNVDLAVKQTGNGRSKYEFKEWVNHNLGLVHMTYASHKLPSEISGGIKQRIAIARSLRLDELDIACRNIWHKQYPNINKQLFQYYLYFYKENT